MLVLATFHALKLSGRQTIGPEFRGECTIETMRPIRWLHISDLHLRVGQEWSQNHVLREMCRNIKRQRESGIKADFVLVTGDIAYSGKAEEYDLARQFFDQLRVHSDVPKERIFCVPGNHDVDRSRQTNAFDGARENLRTGSDVDALIGTTEELQSLLARQENYLQFLESYFDGQDRNWISGGLAYVAKFEVNDVACAVVGLNSAWLAEGGEVDHGNLVIGERQAFDAVDEASNEDAPPHIILAMAHHPFRLLKEFDRLPVQHRIERDCHFFHHGHLHQAETRMGGPSGSQCLTVATGASYAGREYGNSYSMVNLDVFEATRSVQSYQYDNSIGTYSFASVEDQYRINFNSRSDCDIAELAEAIRSYDGSTRSVAYYFAALILGRKSEFPISTDGGHTFGSMEAAETLGNDDLYVKSVNLIRFRNILQIHYGRESLCNIIERFGEFIAQYSAALNVACESDPNLGSRLAERDADARRLAERERPETPSQTLVLFEELHEARDWNLLGELAERHMQSPNPTVAVAAKRMLALCQSNSDETANRSKAKRIYESLLASEHAEASDFANTALLLLAEKDFDYAARLVIDGINSFPESKRLFRDIGNQIVGASGDREFRRRLEEMTRGQV